MFQYSLDIFKINLQTSSATHKPTSKVANSTQLWPEPIFGGSKISQTSTKSALDSTLLLPKKRKTLFKPPTRTVVQHELRLDRDRQELFIILFYSERSCGVFLCSVLGIVITAGAGVTKGRGFWWMICFSIFGGGEISLSDAYFWRRLMRSSWGIQFNFVCWFFLPLCVFFWHDVSRPQWTVF